MSMPRPRRLWLIGLLALALVGCLFRRDGNTSSWMKPFAGPVGADVVVMDVAVLEVPLGDRYVNTELWSAADDQILPPEVRKKLDDNGLRVAKVSGQLPDGLLDLLTNDRSNRNPRQARKRASDAYTVSIGPQHDLCRFLLDGKDDVSNFEQANCAVQITPLLTKEGKVQLQFQPQIQHAGGKRGLISPTIALALQTQKPTETFPSLRWEVPIGHNEYVVVGARFDKPQSLGSQIFASAEGERPVQRLLAVRTARTGPATDVAVPLVGAATRSAAPAAQASTPLAIP